MAYRSILVPLDGSPFGEQALPYALGLAKRAGASVTLVHVHVPVTYYSSADIHLPMPPEEIQLARDLSQAYLDDVTKRVQAISPVRLNSIFLEGFVAEELSTFLENSPHDLVVLTTHGRGQLSRLWLGSVTSEIIQNSTIPLLLIRPEETQPELTSDPLEKMQRLLLPLDGTSFTEQIIPTAIELGSLISAEYRLLRIVPPVLASGWFGPGRPPSGSEEISEKLEGEARTYLEGVVAKNPALQGATIEIQEVWPPAAGILEHAENIQAGLIVMTTHGRGEIARLFLGSIADKVVRGATIPILLRRMTEPEKP